MLLQQVLEELSSSKCSIPSSSEKEDEIRGKDLHLQQQQQHNIREMYLQNEQQYTCGNHNVAPKAADCAKSAPLTRQTSTTNARYLHKAAVAAKEIQVSGHGRLSAPALLANCLLSMISLSDDEDNDDLATAKIEDNSTFTKDEGRNTILKSFSQLRAEERSGKGGHHHSLDIDHDKKLQVVTCCLFPCSRRNIFSKSMGSTLEFFQNADELSSSNEDVNSRSRARSSGGGGALRSLVKKVLCKGSSEVGTGSSIGDHELAFDEQWAAGMPVLMKSPANQDDSDMNIDNHISSMYEYACMYDNAYGNLIQVGKGHMGGMKKSAYALEMDGGEAQEVVHEGMFLSHDAPVASSFVFEQSCFSPSSSTSSTTHCMKLESAHPWLMSGTEDLDSCTTSPQANLPTNRVLHGVIQDDLQFRLANKRLNLSR